MHLNNSAKKNNNFQHIENQTNKITMHFFYKKRIAKD